MTTPFLKISWSLPALALGALATPDLHAQTVDLQQGPGWASIQVRAGATGLPYSDALGEMEFYVTQNIDYGFASKNYWHVMRHNPVTDDYHSVFVSEDINDFIFGFDVGDVDPSPGLELVLLRDDGIVIVYDQATRTEIRRFATSLDEARGLELYSVFGNPELDIVVVSDDGLVVYNASGTETGNFPLAYGRSVVAGQMDADPAIELATSRGLVIDSSTGLLDCDLSHLNYFGDIGATDLDADGMLEIVLHDQDDVVDAYDVDTCTLAWSLPVGYSSIGIRLLDFDADGNEELLLLHDSTPTYEVYDIPSLTLLWDLDALDRSFGGFNTGDFDGDGQVEFIHTAGSNNGGGFMSVIDSATRALEWRSETVTGPYLGPFRGDLDGDGTPEIVAVSHGANGSFGEGRMLVFDGAMNLLAISPEFGDIPDTVDAAMLGDPDQDGKMEILLGTQVFTGAEVRIYDYAAGSFTRVWKNNVPIPDSSFGSLALHDLDGDGQVEVIAGQKSHGGGIRTTSFFVFDYATGNELWHSPSVGDHEDPIHNLSIADLDNDGVLEIAAQVRDGGIFIFDSVTQLLETELLGSFSTLDVLPSAGAASPIILCGNTNGFLSAYRHNNGLYPLLTAFSVATGRIHGVTLTPDHKVLIGDVNQFSLQDPLNGSGILWSTPEHGPDFGKRTLFLPGRGLVTAGFYSVETYWLQ